MTFMNTTKKIFNHGIATFLILYQALLIALLPFYFYFCEVNAATVWVTVILYFLSGLGITAGYHRLYSHRCYKTVPFIDAVMVFFGTLATQGSIIRWSHDHRLHHAFVDTDKDPYSIKKGFWYAHFLWLLDIPKEIEQKVVSDLYENKLLAWQHKHYLSLVIGVNALVFLFFGWLLNDYWGAFFLILWFRMFALHHSTWFINSLAHTWGDKPFSQEQSAVNNYVISLLTFGEGYHNYHHTFANDYRNGIRWYHFDPTKWLIWGLSKIRLASNLKQMDNAVIKKRMVMEHKRLLSERLSTLWWVKCDELEAKLEEISNQIIEKLNKLNELRSQLTLPQTLNSELLQSIKRELISVQKGIKEDWHAWQQLSNHILQLKPLKV